MAEVVATFNTKKKSNAGIPMGNVGNLQGNSRSIQGNNRVIQGSQNNIQTTANPTGMIEVAAAPAAGGYVAPAVDQAALAAQRAEQDRMNRVNDLRGGILGKHQALLDAYNLLFGDIDALARERSGDIETRAGEDIGKLTEQYTGSIPGIVSSYAALGAADSTDTADAKDTAKAGYEDSVDTVGKNKKADLAKIGSYVSEQKAKWNADRDSINRLMGRVGETEDEGDLRQTRNQVEDKIGSLGAERGTLKTDQGARGELTKITGDNGRFEAIQGSLDNIVNSSLAGSVKQAAVDAAANAVDLTDEEKTKIKTMYGNVYDAPVA